jgi:cytochrome c553
MTHAAIAATLVALWAAGAALLSDTDIANLATFYHSLKP